MKLTEMNGKMLVLVLWAIFSALYIGNSIFQDFKNVLLQNAYIAGQNETLTKVVEQASKKECNAFNVSAGEKKVDIINVLCLQPVPASKTANPEPQKK